MPQADIESSSLIMSVVRILTNNRDDRDRVAIKEKLEACLKASDEKLTNLVAENHDELKAVMKNFKGISSNLQTSLTKLGRAKTRLIDCRERLTSKIEELRRLSDESKKNEKILTLLDQVDELSLVPTKINELFNNQEYLKATQMLVDKQKHIEENWDTFDCLKELSSELDEKREEMYRTLREKLFLVDDDIIKNEIVESLRMIDKTPELPYVEVAKETIETTNTTKPSLFKFSLSSHAICFNEHYKEQIEVTKTLLAK